MKNLKLKYDCPDCGYTSRVSLSEDWDMVNFACPKCDKNVTVHEGESGKGISIEVELYGALQWIGGHPILDGMAAFEEKKDCVKYIKGKQDMDKRINQKYTGVPSSKWTMLRVYLRSENEKK